MILIADSGSTKTDWALVTDGQHEVVTTQGINPFHQSREEILRILREELLPQVDGSSVRNVYFYGSGVRPEMKAEMVSIFRETFSHVETVEAHSDLLGAARALCGRNEGIACILGTGANSCLYDGEHIVKNTPALGYILGDEGSGAVLGKRFLHDLYSGLLSEEIKSEFEAFMKMTLADVIRRVYREPLANRFLASLSTFIHDHLDDNDVYELVVGCFRDFFEIHLVAYHRSDLPVSFVGSIAWYYQEILHDVAEREGFRTGTFLRAPLEGLVRYHCL
jgi:N-acetylglucosamine kinase-like BadF-type ATPase